MKKMSSKRILSSTYLLPLLREKNYTLNDLKAEVIIMLFENFLNHYIIGEENKKSQLIFETEEGREESIYIFDKLYQLRKELIENDVLTIDKIQNEVSKSLFIASKLSPYTIMYNSAITTFTKERKRSFNAEELKMWIPDALAVYLIVDAKEVGIDFSKFPLLENETFEDIVNIYTKNNVELRVRQRATNEGKNLLREKSIIGKTINISRSMVDKIVEIK